MKNKVKEQFDARAAKFSGSAGWVTDRRLLAAHKAALAGALPSSGRLLELCCGTGEVTKFIRRRGEGTYGVDISSGMLALAARNIRHVSRADVHKLPFPGGYFDALVMRQAMQFLRPAAFLKEALRVLKPGGTLALGHHVPAGEKERAALLKIYRLIQPSGIFKDPSRLYLAGELKALLEKAGFLVRRSRRLYTFEDVGALMRCYPNLSAARKEEIRAAYGAAARAVPGKKKGGGVRWRWAVFTAVKPLRRA